MPPLLAEIITTTPEPLSPATISLLQGAACLAIVLYAALGAVNQWRKLTGKKGKETTLSPNPLTVQFAKQFATKEELLHLEGRVAGLDQKLDTKFSELSKERSTSIAGLHKRIEAESLMLRKENNDDTKCIHDRINAMLTALSELSGFVKGKNK